jgi:hypothetical protein
MRMAVKKRGVSSSLIVGRSQYLGVVKVYSSREGSLPQSADNPEFVAQQPISGHEPWFESLSDLILPKEVNLFSYRILQPPPV